MTIIRSFLLFSIVLGLSCSETKKKYNYDDLGDTTDVFMPDISRRLTSSPIFNFDFISASSTFKKRLIGIDNINFDDSTDVDTLIQFVSGLDTVVYAKANSGIFLWKMVLASKAVVLDNDVYISCGKNIFKSKLHSDSISDNLFITGDDGGETFCFKFRDDTLREIRYEMHFEAVN